MKSTIFLITLCLGLTLTGQTGQVDLKITGITPEWGGTVKVGIYEKEGFPKEDQALVSETIPAHKLEDAISFKDLPVGTYAIAIYQDINSDEELNRNFYGAPTEPYGFSKNIFGRFGPPKFMEVSFSVKNSETIVLSINLE